MSFGVVALLLAGICAGWLLLRLTNANAEGGRSITILKFVVWFGLAAALFAAKLWPLAFMVLVAAGGVMAIEAWRERTIAETEAALPPENVPRKKITAEEAAAVLGLEPNASVDEIKSAHKKLIAQIHPDKGGTDYLAAKINEARDYLLERIESSDRSKD